MVQLRKIGLRALFPSASRPGNRALTPIFASWCKFQRCASPNSSMLFAIDVASGASSQSCSSCFCVLQRPSIVFQQRTNQSIHRVVATDLLDETPLARPARVDRLAGEHEPGGAARTHEARQQSRFDHRRDAQAHFRHRKARALGGDAQIACGGDLEARADHRAMQPRDDRERKPADRLAHGVDLLDEGAGVRSVQRGELLRRRRRRRTPCRGRPAPRRGFPGFQPQHEWLLEASRGAPNAAH